MGNYPYFQDGAEEQVAYIRLVDPASLPKEIRRETRKMERVYAIHNAEGAVLALTDDRDKAFALARMNDMQLMSVH